MENMLTINNSAFVDLNNPSCGIEYHVFNRNDFERLLKCKDDDIFLSLDLDIIGTKDEIYEAYAASDFIKVPALDENNKEILVPFGEAMDIGDLFSNDEFCPHAGFGIYSREDIESIMETPCAQYIDTEYLEKYGLILFFNIVTL